MFVCLHRHLCPLSCCMCLLRVLVHPVQLLHRISPSILQVISLIRPAHGFLLAFALRRFLLLPFVFSFFVLFGFDVWRFLCFFLCGTSLVFRPLLRLLVVSSFLALLLFANCSLLDIFLFITPLSDPVLLLGSVSFSFCASFHLVYYGTCVEIVPFPFLYFVSVAGPWRIFPILLLFWLAPRCLLFWPQFACFWLFRLLCAPALFA